MLTVGDDFGLQLIEKEGCFQDPAAHRVSLTQTQPCPIGHRTEQMIDMSDAPLNGIGHLIEGGVRMTSVANDSSFAARADKGFRAGQLGCDRRRNNAVGELEILHVLRRYGGSEVSPGVGSFCLATEIWSKEM